MKRYLSNILIYIAALFGIVAFTGLFASPLSILDQIKGTWSSYNVKAYLGEVQNGVKVYKGTFTPVIGFLLPFVMSIFLIIESFRPKLRPKLKIINTLLSILYFASAVLVLLTKELWLTINNYGDALIIRNGVGPIMSAILSTLSGILLTIVTWVPGQKEIDFIDKV